MRWVAAELHTHTNHSDGSFSVEELCTAARASDLQVIAVTDHNTTASVRELSPRLERETIPVIHGMEWTTFWGHLCILGGRNCADWREASPETILKKLEEIRSGGGICGIAHPFAAGSPMCTGGYWNFGLTDFSHISYLELWNKRFPCVRTECMRAVQLWDSLLDRGYRIAAAYGRDWHGPDQDKDPRACTCLRIDGEVTARSAMDAVAHHRTAVTMGPLFQMEAENGAGSGDEIPIGKHELLFSIDYGFRNAQWAAYQIDVQAIQVIGEGGRPVWETKVQAGAGEIRTALDLRGKYVRAQLLGTICGRDAVIAMGTPIFLSNKVETL